MDHKKLKTYEGNGIHLEQDLFDNLFQRNKFQMHEINQETPKRFQFWVIIRNPFVTQAVNTNIAPLLDSKFDYQQCEVIWKRLLALIAWAAEVSNFFPKVHASSVACEFSIYLHFRRQQNAPNFLQTSFLLLFF